MTISLVIYILIILGIRLKKKISIEEFILYSIFYIYICFAINKIFFPLPITDIELFRKINKSSSIIFNYMPLKSVVEIYGNNIIGIKHIIKQIIGNIVLFIPYGFFVPLIFSKLNSFKKLLILGAITSTLIEVIQYVVSSFLGFTYRIADIDDLIYNTLGTLIGFYIYKGVLPLLKKLVLMEKLGV
ncbi:VanZ family protein [Pseudobacteroides cellulosolvens]|nr:VanZ family protein [Pseudobacteroides cellulosolvens]